MRIEQPHRELAKRVADHFARLPQVEAVALAGSRASTAAAPDPTSDIDLYVYTKEDIPLDARAAIVAGTGGSTRSSLDLNYWGASDEWLNAATGIEVDVVYFDARWMENQISRVLERHEASLGYTTCFWHTIRESMAFSDRCGWFAKLQQRCLVTYPEILRQNIIMLNHPVLRSIVPSYAKQLEKAVKRHDLISINHRLAALLASYFDIIFAVNRQLHPGEKRLLYLALNNCKLLPLEMEKDILSVVQIAEANISELPRNVARLLDRLDQMLEDAGLVSR